MEKEIRNLDWDGQLNDDLRQALDDINERMDDTMRATLRPAPARQDWVATLYTAGAKTIRNHGKEPQAAIRALARRIGPSAPAA